MQTRLRKHLQAWSIVSIIMGIARLVWAYNPFSIWLWIALLILTVFITFGIYLTNRGDWSLLIPPYTMGAVAGLLTLTATHLMPYRNAAIYVLPVIALPFLVTYLRSRHRTWALIPTYSLLAITILLVLLGTGMQIGLAIGAYVLLSIALPFLIGHARHPQRTWMLIVGAVTTLTGMGLLIAVSLSVAALVMIALGGGYMALSRANHTLDTPNRSPDFQSGATPPST